MVIAFDIDDTLVKEREFCLSSFSVAAQICTPWLNPHEVMEVMTEALLKRENHYSALEELMEARGVSDKIDMKEIVAACSSHFPRFSTSSMDKARKWV